MHRVVRPVLLSITGALTLVMVSVHGTPSAAAAAPLPLPPPVAPACAAVTQLHQMSCDAVRRTDIAPQLATPAAAPSGYGPSDLQSAYALPSGSAGGGATVAIVDAFDDPNVESDLGTYRQQFGLPACTTANGCFEKVNQDGQTSPLPKGDTSWGQEISLDVDMVSAICPNCHILLVEASSNSDTDLFTGVNMAAGAGVAAISNSYGGAESGGESSFDSQFFNHPGVAITASSGDNGFGAAYPATSQFVTAVGGTTLQRGGGGRGWTESAWSGAGSGCSGSVARPSWQNVSTSCANRAEADVSAVSDPSTGVAVFDTFGTGGWAVFGGTSVAAPIVAAVYALAGQPGAGDFPASYPYAHASSLNDVTSGSNGSCGAPICNAGPGWDGPTGLGTPNGTTAFAP
jgi:subtilase family serine protease